MWISTFNCVTGIVSCIVSRHGRTLRRQAWDLSTQTTHAVGHTLVIPKDYVPTNHVRIMHSVDDIDTCSSPVLGEMERRDLTGCLVNRQSIGDSAGHFRCRIVHVNQCRFVSVHEKKESELDRFCARDSRKGKLPQASVMFFFVSPQVIMSTNPYLPGRSRSRMLACHGFFSRFVFFAAHIMSTNRYRPAADRPEDPYLRLATQLVDHGHGLLDVAMANCLCGYIHHPYIHKRA